MDFYQDEEKNLLRRILNWGVDIILVVAFAWFTVYMFGTEVKIAGNSMAPALESGDVVLMNRLPGVLFGPGRFDLVVFEREDKKTNVKRVIGLPGETVTIRDGKVYINDSTEPLRDDFCPETPVGDFGPYEVPEGCYFMLGDNRNVSKDSRYWLNPYVEKDKIIGKAFLRYWPLNKISLIE